MSDSTRHDNLQPLPDDTATDAVAPLTPAASGATASGPVHRLVSSTVVATWVGAVVLGAGTAVTIQAFASDGHPTQTQGQGGRMGGPGGMGGRGGMGPGGMGGMGGAGQMPGGQTGTQSGNAQAPGGTQAQTNQTQTNQTQGGTQPGQAPAAGSQQNQGQAPPA